MRQDQTQLFKMEYGTRCETFGCGESGEYMVGRPDGPLNTCTILCQECTDSLVLSVKELFNMHEKSVHTPHNELIAFDDTDYVQAEKELDAIRTHTELDDFIKAHSLKGIPSKEEPGGKIHERKAAVLEKLRD